MDQNRVAFRKSAAVCKKQSMEREKRERMEVSVNNCQLRLQTPPPDKIKDAKSRPRVMEVSFDCGRFVAKLPLSLWISYFHPLVKVEVETRVRIIIRKNHTTTTPQTANHSHKPWHFSLNLD